MSDTFQVQSSRDGEKWNGLTPPPVGDPSAGVPGDYWHDGVEKAWSHARKARNALTWSEVRIVRKDPSGQLTVEAEVV